MGFEPRASSYWATNPHIGSKGHLFGWFSGASVMKFILLQVVKITRANCSLKSGKFKLKMIKKKAKLN